MTLELVPKRILVAVFFPRHVGGLQTHFDFLVQGLLNAGVEVFPLQREGDHLKLLKKALYALRSGFSRERAVSYLLSQDMMTFSALVRKVVGERKAELLHCHDAFSVYCAKDLKLPLVLTVHGPLHLEYRMLGWKDEEALNWLRSIEKFAYERADVIITVDSGLKNYVVHEFNVDSDKVQIIRNAVDAEKVIAFSQKECDFCKDICAFFALVPRRLVPKNGVVVAVKAMRFLKEQPFKLVIAGDGPERRKIVALLKEYGLQEKVVLLGEVPHEQLFPLMKRSFAVVIPSVPSKGVVEATSLAALEAMALGKVVVVSNIGGLRELVEDGVDGFVFEPGHEEHLANILMMVFKSEELRSSIGLNAQKKVCAHYVTPVWLGQILEVYQKVYGKIRT